MDCACGTFALESLKRCWDDCFRVESYFMSESVDLADVALLDSMSVLVCFNFWIRFSCRQALARDKAEREGIPRTRAYREVSTFVQNIHHFRDGGHVPRLFFHLASCHGR